MGQGKMPLIYQNMFSIKGGIKFEKDKDIPLKMKDHIAKNGIMLPFNPKNFRYSNNKIDSFLVAKEKINGKKFKFNRLNNSNTEVLTI